jgi:radical SAM protein with 4Fe4S-binding SPASM domain
MTGTRSAAPGLVDFGAPEPLSAAVPVNATLPHVVAWNLTRRCNLKCSHCYISAGPAHTAAGELDTETCFRVIDELLALNPNPMLILSGGEPLLRDDLAEIAAHASQGGATVVVGTNGTLLTDAKIGQLMAAGVSGVAVSVDSLRPSYHDNFRRGADALADTVASLERMRRHHLDFIVQTSVTRGNAHEISAILDWAAEQGAVSFNCYFLVPTGRAERLAELDADAHEELLAMLAEAEGRYRGTMMVRAKCAPHFIRLVHQADPASPVLNYQTRCPCGIQYCRITPEGTLTPCPYLPTEAGDLRTQSFADIWNNSPLFGELRGRDHLGGKCGQCEYRMICGGCRARAFAATGDYLAEDPSCSYVPDGTREVIARREVSYGAAVAPALRWSPAAEERLKKIPSFVRGVVVKRIEDFAKARGLSVIEPELLSEIRSAMPIDFSRRKPFFVRDADA